MSHGGPVIDPPKPPSLQIAASADRFIRAVGAPRKETEMNLISNIRDSSDRYARCIQTSKRVRWDIDKDVIRGRNSIPPTSFFQMDFLWRMRSRPCRPM